MEHNDTLSLPGIAIPHKYHPFSIGKVWYHLPFSYYNAQYHRYIFLAKMQWTLVTYTKIGTAPLQRPVLALQTAVPIFIHF